MSSTRTERKVCYFADAQTREVRCSGPGRWGIMPRVMYSLEFDGRDKIVVCRSHKRVIARAVLVKGGRVEDETLWGILGGVVLVILAALLLLLVIHLVGYAYTQVFYPDIIANPEGLA